MQTSIETLQKIELYAPDALKNAPQWAVWKYETREGKSSKPSFDAKSGRYASSTNKDTWSSYEQAAGFLLANHLEYDGLTFALTLDTGIVAIDLDHCLYFDETINGRKLTPQALEICKIANSYTERSPSKNGLHILIEGQIQGLKRKSSTAELYENARFITVTGDRVGKPTEIRANQEAINKIYALSFPPETRQQPEKPASIYQITQSDSRVLAKARAAKNGYKFIQLYDNGNYSDYQKNNGENEADKSRADLALCSMLAYWTNSNESQIDSLFRRSKLYSEKWDTPHYQNGETYGQHTIKQAIDELRKY